MIPFLFCLGIILIVVGFLFKIISQNDKAIKKMAEDVNAVFKKYGINNVQIQFPDGNFRIIEINQDFTVAKIDSFTCAATNAEINRGLEARRVKSNDIIGLVPDPIGVRVIYSA